MRKLIIAGLTAASAVSITFAIVEVRRADALPLVLQEPARALGVADVAARSSRSAGGDQSRQWFRSAMTIERPHSLELLDWPEEIDLLGPASQSTSQARRGTVLKPD